MKAIFCHLHTFCWEIINLKHDGSFIAKTQVYLYFGKLRLALNKTHQLQADWYAFNMLFSLGCSYTPETQMARHRKSFWPK